MALSPSNDFVKERLPKQRERSGLVLAEGVRLVREALAGAWEVEALLVTPESALDHGSEIALAETRRIPVRELQAQALARLSTQTSPPPVSAVVKVPAERPIDPTSAARWLVLDGVADPGNAGTLLRTAYAFGFRTLLVGGVGPGNEKFIRASVGVAFREGALAVWPEGGAALCDAVISAGGTVLGLDGAAPMELNDGIPAVGRPLVLVVGNEANGSRPEDWPGARWIRLPMPGGAESLNASVAGAIALWEVLRRSV